MIRAWVWGSADKVPVLLTLGELLNSLEMGWQGPGSLLISFITAAISDDISEEQQRQWECRIPRGRASATQALRDGEFSLFATVKA